MEKSLKKKKIYSSYVKKDFGVSVFAHSKEGSIPQV